MFGGFPKTEAVGACFVARLFGLSRGCGMVCGTVGIVCGTVGMVCGTVGMVCLSPRLIFFRSRAGFRGGAIDLAPGVFREVLSPQNGLPPVSSSVRTIAALGTTAVHGQREDADGTMKGHGRRRRTGRGRGYYVSVARATTCVALGWLVGWLAHGWLAVAEDCCGSAVQVSTPVITFVQLFKNRKN
jgi:hypothetical protein